MSAHVTFADAAVVAETRDDTFDVLTQGHVICVVVLILLVKRYSLLLVLSADFVNLGVDVVFINFVMKMVRFFRTFVFLVFVSAQSDQELFVVKYGPVFVTVRDQERCCEVCLSELVDEVPITTLQIVR